MFDELADGVFRRHYEFLSLNIGVVVGEDGVLIIDSRESHEAARELQADILTLTSKPVRWVVNTHWHWDHSFGNAVFPEATIWGHRLCRQRLLDRPMDARRDARKWMPEARYGEIDSVDVVPPGQTFDAIASIDVGTHQVDLGFHGRGHTDNDIVAHVANVTFMGDLVEESGAPYMGEGFMLDWPVTLSVIQPSAGEVIVPGHGAVCTHDWLASQQMDMEQVATRLRNVLFHGGSLDKAVRGGPFPEPDMRQALVRGTALAAGG